jgi:Lrp/AsnC family transcriptional regulator for asnA, asnC and gidA
MARVEPIDRQIVDLLMEDGRMPCAEIARRIGCVSERTVRYRLERLQNLKIVHVVAIPNPSALGYAVIADVFLEVKPALILQVAQRMQEFDCVTYIGCALGERDVSIQVVARDNAEVYDFVTGVVAKVPGVRKTTTVILPKILKDVYQWRIPARDCVQPREPTPPQGPSPG